MIPITIKNVNKVRDPVSDKAYVFSLSNELTCIELCNDTLEDFVYNGR